MISKPRKISTLSSSWFGGSKLTDSVRNPKGVATYLQKKFELKYFLVNNFIIQTEIMTRHSCFTDLMYDYEMEHKDFLGLVVDKINEDQADGGVVRYVDAEEEDIFVPYVKEELDEETVMEAIYDYDQDYICMRMDDWTEQMDFAECIAFIIEEYGSDYLDGMDARQLWRIAKVVAFQQVCIAQYDEIKKS
jgi:hypothetical protein